MRWLAARESDRRRIFTMEEQCGFKGSKYPWGRIPARFLIAGGVAAVAGILVLFPFDWLGEVWPAYAAVFDRVFVNAQAHLIGHATLFGVAGLLVLYAFPPLRGRPGRYLLVMAMGAVGQEALKPWPSGRCRRSTTGAICCWTSRASSRRICWRRGFARHAPVSPGARRRHRSGGILDASQNHRYSVQCAGESEPGVRGIRRRAGSASRLVGSASGRGVDRHACG